MRNEVKIFVKKEKLLQKMCIPVDSFLYILWMCAWWQTTMTKHQCQIDMTRHKQLLLSIFDKLICVCLSDCTVTGSKKSDAWHKKINISHEDLYNISFLHYYFITKNTTPTMRFCFNDVVFKGARYVYIMSSMF